MGEKHRLRIPQYYGFLKVKKKKKKKKRRH